MSEPPQGVDGPWQSYSRPRRRRGFLQGPAIVTDDEEIVRPTNGVVVIESGALVGAHANGSAAAGPWSGSTQANDHGLPTERSSASSSWPSSEGLGHTAELDAKQGPRNNNSIGEAAAVSDTLSAWKRYLEPGSNRLWFMNDPTQEVFYADDLESGWERYLDSHGKPWWEHQASGRHFYEPQC